MATDNIQADKQKTGHNGTTDAKPSPQVRTDNREHELKRARLLAQQTLTAYRRVEQEVCSLWRWVIDEELRDIFTLEYWMVFSSQRCLCARLE